MFRQTNSAGYGRAYAGTATDDEIVQARIRPTSFVGPDNWVGLMARYRDDDNYLYVSLRARGVISLWRRSNGVITQLATRPLTVTAGTWYAVRMEVVDDRTRVYVNDQLCCLPAWIRVLRARMGSKDMDTWGSLRTGPPRTSMISSRINRSLAIETRD